MEKKASIRLGNRLHMIDGFDLDMPGRTGIYVLEQEQLTLVETGPSLSVPYIVAELKDMGYDLSEVRYIIVTHIHLDHAGGVGLLLEHCPNAEVIVHPRGKRHLADPARLTAGARQVYGDDFDELFNPVLPVPESKLLTKEDGDTLRIGPDCLLTFYHTRGHANHHFTIHDSSSNGVFTGDAAGICYHQTQDCGLTFYLPTTSPNQFDPNLMQETLKKLRSLKPDRIYFGHFGESLAPETVFDQVSAWLPKFMKAGEAAVSNKEGVIGVKKRLHEEVSHYLRKHGVPDDHQVYNILEIDFEICAMGIVDYLAKSTKG